MPKYCFIIPSYQHSFTLEKILRSIEPYSFKVFVVDDGSDNIHKRELKRLASLFNFVEWLEHPENRGKGSAFETGMRKAVEQGFTHGIQIDSDGQHDLSKLTDLIELSKKFPYDLISGQPQYDESVPKARVYGRYATHIWVWIETLSLKIKDSMCGFRVYPLSSTIRLMDHHKIGSRMDFDIEVVVRLFWSGVNIRFITVPVHYPKDGISHFDVWKDNVRITKMHTRLFFGMLLRLPLLLWRKAYPKQMTDKPWFKVEEAGTRLGIKTILFFYRVLGRRGLKFVLYPVCFYYSLFSSTARKSSQDYQERLRRYTNGNYKKFSVLDHIYSFATSAVDKFAVWFGDIRYEDLNQDDVKELLKVAEAPQGAFFLSSHFGNIEVCRALGRFSKVRFNALVYHENAQRFNSLLSEVNSESNLNLISVKNMGPEVAIQLKEKSDNKEWIFMMGDRQAVDNESRLLKIFLLGTEAKIAEGPFIMSYLLDVPLYVIHCYREDRKFRIQLKHLETNAVRGSKTRTQWIQDMAQRYANELEGVILKDPLQWYNFFNFWRTT